MGSDDQLHLPKIDFSGLNPSAMGTDEWAATRVLVKEAMEACSCFEAVYDKVTPELKDALFGKAMKDLFALPVEARMKNTSNKPRHGYIGNMPGVPYESLGINNVLECNSVEEFSTLMWGDEGNPSFRNTIHQLAKQLSRLEQMVRRMLLEILGVEKYFDESVESTVCNLRMSEYGKHVDGTARKLLPRHTDVNLLGIVCQHGVEGLQVQTKDGRWLTPSPSSLIVLIGQAFWAWSNGRIEPTYHQVVTPGDENRYTAILCIAPRDGYMVQAPKELVDDKHPLEFRPYEYADYIKLYYPDGGAFRGPCPLKDYCGISRVNDA